MDADDLEYWHRTGSGGIPSEVVERLLERGHGAVVAEQAGRGEWFCAKAWAQVLAGDGRLEDALGVLAPYAATTWWTAVVEVAGLLEDAGRIEEAIETVRARMALGHPHALEQLRPAAYPARPRVGGVRPAAAARRRARAHQRPGEGRPRVRT
ncbi:hypothetical protein [Streptomyces sp. TLI_171]|uniref:hypothetical protein n=1 Tax=Streptomyces sp. TLI_171 TaxID=1938859 RepID=UPI000C181D01|nr:hypothetical protein [Streptomyces sp. TLI_171]